MIAKLECFWGHCHIAPDQLGLARLFRLFPVWTILWDRLWNLCLFSWFIQAKDVAMISWYLADRSYSRERRYVIYWLPIYLLEILTPRLFRPLSFVY